jgi:hypothetical protein
MRLIWPRTRRILPTYPGSRRNDSAPSSSESEAGGRAGEIRKEEATTIIAFVRIARLVTLFENFLKGEIKKAEERGGIFFPRQGRVHSSRPSPGARVSERLYRSGGGGWRRGIVHAVLCRCGALLL